MANSLAAHGRPGHVRDDRAFEVVTGIGLGVISLLVLYPLYFVIIASISDPALVNTGKVWLIPRKVTFEGFRIILQTTRIWQGYANTILYTSFGTLFGTALTLSAAYALSRKKLFGRKLFTTYYIITMFFHGGLVPTYLVVRGLGMLNTRWAVIIVGSVAVWNIIITRTFYQSTIPNELYESAELDGCGDGRAFWSIVLPLSGSIVIVNVLFYAVMHWNDFFRALVYLRDRDLQPLQLVLREILLQAEIQDEDLDAMIAAVNSERQDQVAELIRYGTIVVSSLPLLVLYPFLQKHFVKGMLIGSIKS